MSLRFLSRLLPALTVGATALPAQSVTLPATSPRASVSQTVGITTIAVTYGLFMALTEAGEVTVIFSRESGAWGSFFYDPAQDALRVTAKWEDAPFREQLAYEFSEVNAAAIKTNLEKLKRGEDIN